MEEVTCPNCNVDIDAEELRQNNLCCPTCGFDLSERDQDEDDDDDDDDDEDDENKKLDDEKRDWYVAGEDLGIGEF